MTIPCKKTICKIVAFKAQILYYPEMRTEDISSILKRNNLKSTRSRKAVLSVLHNTAEPLDVKTLHTKLRRRSTQPHLTTLYRDLEIFQKKGIVEECNIFGAKEYQIKKHVKHIHCTQCNLSQPLSKKSIDSILQVQKETGFQLDPQTHIHGVCKSCIEKTP